jgi:hypothetical protein
MMPRSSFLIGFLSALRYNDNRQNFEGATKMNNNNKELEEKIISNYQKDENMMILVFAQWCVNNDLNPVEIYKAAYPEQAANHALKQGIELTVAKEESEEIPDSTLLGVLSLFGNTDLAIVVSEEMARLREPEK